jgi:serine/threonine-protein kinase
VAREQQKWSVGAGVEQRSCAVCGAAVDASRCAECGVAVSPGGWRIVRQLAKGPHSRVFLAEKDGQQVALKELLFALVPEAAQLEGFEREAKLLAQLSHPSIPKLVEFFREGEGINTRLYLAQQFVRGSSLLDELERHRFDEREAKALARELLAVIGYLQGLSPRVIHRDLKPANVMRREDGSLAVVDFGSARDLVRGVTHGSTLVGTFGYMPPEQLGGTVDLTSDLYALGATLLHLLSRKPPDELVKPGMELAFEGEVNVSDGFRGWLHKSVQRDRTARFQSAKAALEALDALDRPAKPKEQPRAARAPKTSSPWGLVRALVLLAAVTGMVVWEIARDRPAPRPAIPQPVTVVTPKPPPVQPPKVSRPPAVAPAPPVSHADVVTVPKVKPLPPFTVEWEFTTPVNAEVKLADHDAAGAACDSPSSLSLGQLTAVPGSPASLVLGTELASHGGPPGCANVYVELLDQHGQRAVATLVSNPTSGTTKKSDIKLALPENSRLVQLRVGPQGSPYAVFDVDLEAHKVFKR